MRTIWRGLLLDAGMLPFNFNIAFITAAFVAGLLIGYGVRAMISHRRRAAARSRARGLSEDRASFASVDLPRAAPLAITKIRTTNEKNSVACRRCNETGLIAGIVCGDCRGKGYRTLSAGKRASRNRATIEKRDVKQ